MVLRVLLVDDNREFRCYLKHYLESWANCSICGEASDGLEAIEQTESLTPDLVIMDLAMPKMNGLEASRALRERKSSVPIVLFSLYGTGLTDSDLCRSGISAVFSKNQPELLAAHIALRADSPAV